VVVPPGWAFTREVAHFVEAVANGTPFRSDGPDSAADLALLEAVFRAAQ
jgi:predicted dehydrogenase